jgi:hypothetical protein
LVEVAGERNIGGKTQANVIAKMHDKDFIAPIAGANENQRRRQYLRALGPHAAAHVDNQTSGDRDILACEMGNGLELPVFVHPEIVLCQARDMFIRNGLDTHIQQDELSGHAELERLLGCLNRGHLGREYLRGYRQPEDENVS